MYDRHVRARLIDFFALEGLQWPRRLWDVGSLLALEELLEASSWARHRVLSVAAVDWQRRQLLKVIGPDLGLADRLAAIVACSWPRAELTALAHRYQPESPDALAETLATCTTNRERACAMAEALVAGNAMEMADCYRRDADVAAVHRMRRLVTSPKAELASTAAIFEIAMRRLYRTRNIVLHGGSVQGVALKAALRVAAPLVGAGLDRITNASLVEGLPPLDLAARAEVGLQLVGGETGLKVVDLLMPRR